MCGIAGELTFDGRPVLAENIRSMMDALAHRGPDAEGIFCSGSIGFGHRRLSIIDLTDAGRQPIWNDSGTLVIIYNGEVYNYRELRKQLHKEGKVFRTETDTEVILKAIEAWGIDAALSKFIGMFAFALWDAKNLTLTLCRDRVGIKPLYYAHSPNGILFASELKGLIANPGFNRRVNPVAIGQSLITGFAIGSTTPFVGAERLLAGHYLKVTVSGVLERRQYWSLSQIERGSFHGTFNDAVECLQSLCESAFRYRLVSDVPVGMFQSGGVDSSLVAAVLKKCIGADVLSITIGFGEEEYSEAQTAKTVTESLGVRHLVHSVSSEEAQGVLSRFVDIFDEPFGDTSGIPTYILASIARQHVKVALSADGGDEQFCGYESYGAYDWRARSVANFPLVARRLLTTVLRRWFPYRAIHSWRGARATCINYAPQDTARFEKMLRVLTSPSAAHVLQRMNEFAFQSDEIAALLPGAGADPLLGTSLSAEMYEGYRQGLLDAMMRTDYTTYLPDDILFKVDRASMAASLECRDPLLDHRIAEFAFRLPVEFLYHSGEHKRLLKALARRWISADVLNSPKRGFVIPLYYWLRGAWKPMVLDTLTPNRLREVGILDPAAVGKEIDSFYAYAGGRAERIWMLLNIQLWAERWL